MVRDYVPTWCFIGREGCIRANDLQAMTRSAGMTELVCRTGVEQKCFGARPRKGRATIADDLVKPCGEFSPIWEG